MLITKAHFHYFYYSKLNNETRHQLYLNTVPTL